MSESWRIVKESQLLLSQRRLIEGSQREYVITESPIDPPYLVDIFFNNNGRLVVLLSLISSRDSRKVFMANESEWSIREKSSSTIFQSTKVFKSEGAFSTSILIFFDTIKKLEESFDLTRNWIPTNFTTFQVWHFPDLTVSKPLFNSSTKFNLVASTMISDFYFRRWWLEPWIKWHRDRGVEHFIIYLNFEDCTIPRLRDWRSGQTVLFNIFDNPTSHDFWKDITLVPFYFPLSTHRSFAFQFAQKHHSIQSFKNISVWQAHMDTDEYFFPVQSQTLDPILLNYVNDEGVDCIAAPHVFFVDKTEKESQNINARKSCSNSVLDCVARGEFYSNRLRRTKVIIKTENVDSIMSVHRCIRGNVPIDPTILRLNHYKLNCTYWEGVTNIIYDDSGIEYSNITYDDSAIKYIPCTTQI